MIDFALAKGDVIVRGDKSNRTLFADFFPGEAKVSTPRDAIERLVTVVLPAELQEAASSSTFRDFDGEVSESSPFAMLSNCELKDGPSITVLLLEVGLETLFLLMLILELETLLPDETDITDAIKVSFSIRS